MRTAKEYSVLLRYVLKMQIAYIRENENYETSDYLQGQEVGLMTAIDKIDASGFLME